MTDLNARRAILLIMALFAFQPLVMGAWFALIPYVKSDLGLSKGQLAVALLGSPAALLPGLQVAGRVVSRSGPRRVFFASFPAQGMAVMLPLLAWNGASLFMALAFVGISIAFAEVALNTYAGRLEKNAGVLIMNRCHGFWAAGLAIGSAAIAVLSQLNPFLSLGMVAVVSTVGGLYCARLLPRLAGEELAQKARKRRLRDLPKALFLIALAMSSITLTEGAMADWAAIHLGEQLGDIGSRGAIAVTIFATFLAGGRFLGDALKARMGAVALGRATVGCALIGLLLLVLPLPVQALYFGFALVGFGVSAGYPLGVSAVAALDNEHEASNIAIMSTVALCGFLVGPPLIGSIAEIASLTWGLAALIPGLIVSILFMSALESPKNTSESASESL